MTVQTNDLEAILKITGNVRSVLSGKATQLQEVNQKEYRFALGSGTFTNPEKIGETLILENRINVSWVENSQVKTGSDAKVYSPFLVGVDNQQKEKGIYTYTPQTPRPIQKLYQELLLQFTQGFAIVGQFLFSELRTTYLKTSPIYEEDINQNAEKYWQNVITDKDRAACLFGVVFPEALKDKSLEASLLKALYQSPKESKSFHFMSHTHAALQESGFEEGKELFIHLKTMKPQAIRHLLTQSSIKKALFAIYPIGTIDVN